MNPFPPHIVEALERAFADLQKNHGWDEEEAMNQIVQDWLITNGYLQHDESTDIELPEKD